MNWWRIWIDETEPEVDPLQILRDEEAMIEQRSWRLQWEWTKWKTFWTVESTAFRPNLSSYTALSPKTQTNMNAYPDIRNPNWNKNVAWKASRTLNYNSQLSSFLSCSTWKYFLKLESEAKTVAVKQKSSGMWVHKQVAEGKYERLRNLLQPITFLNYECKCNFTWLVMQSKRDLLAWSFARDWGWINEGHKWTPYSVGLYTSEIHWMRPKFRECIVLKRLICTPPFRSLSIVIKKRWSVQNRMPRIRVVGWSTKRWRCSLVFEFQPQEKQILKRQ